MVFISTTKKSEGYAIILKKYLVKNIKNTKGSKACL